MNDIATLLFTIILLLGAIVASVIHAAKLHSETIKLKRELHEERLRSLTFRMRAPS